MVTTAAGSVKLKCVTGLPMGSIGRRLQRNPLIRVTLSGAGILDLKPLTRIGGTVMHTRKQPSRTRWLWSRQGLVLIGFLAVAAFYLWTEHRAHTLGVLPFLLFLLCPLLHLLMHGRHGARHQHGSDANRGGVREGPGQ
jgi:hypothetical protein